MREIKFLLKALAIAAYTSLWWATFMFGFPDFIIIILFLSTMGIIVLCLIYLFEHWDDNFNNMKEIKFLFQSLIVTAYTSLWWATFMFDGLKVTDRGTPPGETPLGIILLMVSTVGIIAFFICYLIDNWTINSYNEREKK